MLGNQLNPNSNMAQKMTDHLNSELEAHSIFSTSDNSSNIMGPQLHHRVIISVSTFHLNTNFFLRPYTHAKFIQARQSNANSNASASGLSSMLGGSGGVIPQTLDQLLERQWEQGSQFLMEQAQHFDSRIIPSVLCLFFVVYS